MRKSCLFRIIVQNTRNLHALLRWVDMDLGLKGKSVLVTGASQGIGEGVARSFAEEGCHLHLVARSGDRLAAIKSEIETAHDVDVAIHAKDLTAPGVIEPCIA